MTHDGRERGIGPVVEVRRRQLDVAERRDPEGEAVELVVRQVAAAEVERRPRPGAWTELRCAGVREALPAEERPVVAARAYGLLEEQQRAALLLRRQGAVVPGEVAVERGVRLREGLHLEGSDRGGGVLETQLVRRHAGKGRVEQRHVLGDRERSEEHTSELQSHHDLVCRLLLEKKK